jgi:two-component sensor histidine kinase
MCWRATKKPEGEKALMFEELGHRTKNNLHMIASVLGCRLVNCGAPNPVQFWNSVDRGALYSAFRVRVTRLTHSSCEAASTRGPEHDDG